MFEPVNLTVGELAYFWAKIKNDQTDHFKRFFFEIIQNWKCPTANLLWTITPRTKLVTEIHDKLWALDCGFAEASWPSTSVMWWQVGLDLYLQQMM